MLKWVVKRVKSESKPKPNMPIELKPIVKIWKLKLPKPIVREPNVITNPVRSRPPRRPRRSKQQPIGANSFVAPVRLTDLDLDRPHNIDLENNLKLKLLNNLCME